MEDLTYFDYYVNIYIAILNLQIERTINLSERSSLKLIKFGQIARRKKQIENRRRN